jgi:spore coat protein U-like protein
MRWSFAAAIILLAAHDAQPQCVVTAVPVDFGVYRQISAIPADSNGTIAIHCRFFGPYSIAINSPGTGNFTGRHMSRSGSQLFYQLYTDAARRTVWGDGTGGSATVSGFCAGSCDNNHSVYGRLPPRQSVAPGTYTDTVVVTVVF